MKEKKKVSWVFMAYETEENYPDFPYFYKVFKNHEKLKVFSGEHSFEERKKFPNYCSSYFKFEM